ncbi:hypothetical protein B0T26DRAFT_812578 [Lasiosphaeria miniovina]|uniref:NECAP PHear domain-containing protein n=1 Tax=Lasiosphaeria miniovina TaxID=1954250 RepID=A0AA40E0F1_9PEZI|nr:uncharacterized protein B0T26DRAFT_812578 [Lasiosphaeria miniovina]KAK0718098.1 hypothetical protein B0T26DRAFT_812578 [Lasiosphaeria miniovina]
MEPAIIDPATGRALPADAIQRILHISRAVHVYNIPPMTSTRGHTAATWTEDPTRHIFTCRARIIETAIPRPGSDSINNNDPAQDVKVDVILEDAGTGQLFAAAPYTSAAVVEPALDSSRFFAVRERSEAFDFSIALQEAQKALGFKGKASGCGGQQQQQDKKDYSLKDGETITVNLSGTKFGRRAAARTQEPSPTAGTASLSSFALAPPPSAAAPAPTSSNAFLPPPPSAQEIRAQKRMSAQNLGFDDGKFGEFA